MPSLPPSLPTLLAQVRFHALTKFFIKSISYALLQMVSKHALAMALPNASAANLSSAHVPHPSLAPPSPLLTRPGHPLLAPPKQMLLPVSLPQELPVVSLAHD